MKLVIPKQVFTADRQVDDAVRHVSGIQRDLGTIPFLQGKYAVQSNGSEDLELVANNTMRFLHRLGRKPHGWFPVFRQANGMSAVAIWQTDESDDRFIYVRGLNSCTISIWVF